MMESTHNAMMESIALNESHVVDDGEYIFVEAADDDMDVDDDSYDHCDEFVSISPTPSVAASISSDLLKELGSLAEESISASVVSMEETVDCGDEGSRNVLPTFTETGTLCDTEETSLLAVDPDEAREESTVKGIDDRNRTHGAEDRAPTERGSRLSNKKRRKKMKMMKKAAAAAAAAAALADQISTSGQSSAVQSSSTKHRQKKKSASKTKKISNVAVACATESLAAYREEHNLKPKKTMPNYVSLL